MEMINLMSFNVEPINNFQEWLKEELETRNISVATLATKSGLPASSIYGYLAYAHEPSLFTAQCIYNALGYEIGVIVNDYK